MLRILYRLIAYKNYQLRYIEKIKQGNSTQALVKLLEKAHNYSISQNLVPLKTISEKTMWNYYLYLDAKLTVEMENLKREYKDRLVLDSLWGNIIFRKNSET